MAHFPIPPPPSPPSPPRYMDASDPDQRVPSRGALMGRNRNKPRLMIKQLSNDNEIHDHYTTLQLLGRGGEDLARTFDVRLVRHKRIRCAMKVQSLVPDSDEDEIEEDAEGRVMNEIQILNNVLPPHKHIVELRDILLGVEKFFIVTERCASNDLVEFYPTANNTRARNIFKQLVETVQFMHDYGVVHYDLKAQNVLFDTTLMRDIKIIDFNKARYYRDLATKTYNNFNPDRYYWSDRHNFRPGDPYKQTLPDIRQLGNILYSMLAGTEVQLGVDDFYETDDLPEVRTQVFSSEAIHLLSLIGPSKWLIPNPGPRSALRLTNNMRLEPVTPVPGTREILQHPWIA
ncbi:hypothetical protein MPTK1_5g02860 [Marchantia polymorpha subsp. ruderalis]|uniref:Protein kinase domain-containing protein n=2 Tax=Marchantia polymorpha TaxID=3197 RepID=A0AAF6BEC0_MARPO|nr:hypothetical protein MARPO_0124s0037 [Marchantia polymorpha]BBN10354.1 hypothetical protein Mp_5g02860 [Marchantia polymorpha subsp. ruderalis]|eukprot:PTQ30464.1 hypothetical protein MARPO_0124s0037 [Marchantia polymorpha]